MASKFDTGKGIQQSFSPQFVDHTRDIVNQNFKKRFEEPHRRLKANIHRCQAHAYAKQGVGLEKSEQVARACMLPLLLVRRHAQTIVANATDEYDVCLAKVDDQRKDNPKLNLEQARMGCVTAYRNTLQSYVSSVDHMYEGYSRNFNPHDGSLVSTNWKVASTSTPKDQANFIREIEKLNEQVEINTVLK